MESKETSLRGASLRVTKQSRELKRDRHGRKSSLAMS
jgi:hypothetical protein